MSNRPCKYYSVLVAFALLIEVHSARSQTVAARDGLMDKSIAELSNDLQTNRITSVQLVHAYLAQIEALNRKGPALHAVIAINPDALSIAKKLDEERIEQGARGPLHGIPILLKDNIESTDPMATTAGSLALLKNFAKHDAPVVARLRAAGAIILGKTNLSEWANFRSEHSISGWSAVGGLTKNPHVLDRSACGSSAGSAVAVAALFAAASVGTETDGSITCPASMNGVVGLKPTLGLLPQQGIVPIAHSQDTAGPMARSVADVATMLDAMVGSKHGYAASLSANSLAGKRIGVWRFRADRQQNIDVVYERALQVLHAAGATLIEVPTPESTRIEAAEETVLTTEFKTDLNVYLAATPSSVTMRTLGQLIAFNNMNEREHKLFGQELFVAANAAKNLDDPTYKIALADSKRLAGAEGISRVLANEHLDFIVAPTAGPSWRIDLVSGDQFPGSFSTLPAVSGYPHLTVPMGTIKSLPIGLSFIGPPLSEALLLSVGFAYEQKAKVNVHATFKPTLETEAEFNPIDRKKKSD